MLRVADQGWVAEQLRLARFAIDGLLATAVYAEQCALDPTELAALAMALAPIFDAAGVSARTTGFPSLADRYRCVAKRLVATAQEIDVVLAAIVAGLSEGCDE